MARNRISAPVKGTLIHSPINDATRSSGSMTITSGPGMVVSKIQRGCGPPFDSDLARNTATRILSTHLDTYNYILPLDTYHAFVLRHLRYWHQRTIQGYDSRAPRAGMFDRRLGTRQLYLVGVSPMASRRLDAHHPRWGYAGGDPLALRGKTYTSYK